MDRWIFGEILCKVTGASQVRAPLLKYKDQKYNSSVYEIPTPDSSILIVMNPDSPVNLNKSIIQKFTKYYINAFLTLEVLTNLKIFISTA